MFGQKGNHTQQNQPRGGGRGAGKGRGGRGGRGGQGGCGAQGGRGRRSGAGRMSSEGMSSDGMGPYAWPVGPEQAWQPAQPAQPDQSAQAAPVDGGPRMTEAEAVGRGLCPICENHCPLSEPGCGKGKVYAKSLQAAANTEARA